YQKKKTNQPPCRGQAIWPGQGLAKYGTFRYLGEKHSGMQKLSGERFFICTACKAPFSDRIPKLFPTFCADKK
ncbi:hypothetical protein, partial [Candidatus Avelusimicrobium alvi]|uniref:hypothetical protein n=1 Tax=Candidatus Avelusimicrobium alvi TaxID=3416221 RepID=UPI003D0F4510